MAVPTHERGETTSTSTTDPQNITADFSGMRSSSGPSVGDYLVVVIASAAMDFGFTQITITAPAGETWTTEASQRSGSTTYSQAVYIFSREWQSGNTDDTPDFQIDFSGGTPNAHRASCSYMLIKGAGSKNVSSAVTASGANWDLNPAALSSLDSNDYLALVVAGTGGRYGPSGLTSGPGSDQGDGYTSDDVSASTTSAYSLTFIAWDELSSKTGENPTAYDLPGTIYTNSESLCLTFMFGAGIVAVAGDGRASARPTAALTTRTYLTGDGRASARPTANVDLDIALIGDGRASARPTAALTTRTYLTSDGRAAAQPTALLSPTRGLTADGRAASQPTADLTATFSFTSDGRATGFSLGFIQLTSDIFLVPVSTTGGTGWDTAPIASQNLHDQVDEVPPSDTDYIFVSI